MSNSKFTEQDLFPNGRFKSKLGDSLEPLPKDSIQQLESFMAAFYQMSGQQPPKQPPQQVSKPTLPASNRYAAHASVIYDISKAVAEKTAELLKSYRWPNQRVGDQGRMIFSVTVHDEYVRIAYQKLFRFDFCPISNSTVYLLYSTFGMGNVYDKEPLLDALLYFLRTEFPDAVQSALSSVRGVNFTPAVSKAAGGDNWVIGDLADHKRIDLRLDYYVAGDPNLTAW